MQISASKTDSDSIIYHSNYQERDTNKITKQMIKKFN